MKRAKLFLAPSRMDVVLVVLSAASGAAALIYEIIWFQLLQLVIGSAAISLGVLLASFMGGMCIGSLILPRVIGVRPHPLWVYALIELAIGGLGIGILIIMPHVAGLYAANALQGLPDILLRVVIGAAILLPPTILMGATLPALARWMGSARRGVSRLGAIYASNIVGAVFGCLLAGFYLLRVYDSMTATFVGAAINVAVGLTSALLATMLSYAPSPDHRAEVASRRASSPWSVYVAISLSGLTALGAEVIWTRLLSLLFGATVYTFSLILAVFLLGLGIGSAAASYIVRRAEPRISLGICQVLLVFAIAWAAYMIGSSLPYWPIYPPLAPSPWFTFQVDLFSCAIVILPAACCWGASFPFALGAVVFGSDAGRPAAAVYAANTIGAICGALGFSMVLIPWLGPQRAQQLLIGISAAAGLLMLLPSRRLVRTAPSDGAGEPAPELSMVIAVPALALVAALLMATVPDIPDKLVAFGRSLLTSQPSQVIYRGDGRVSSVAVTEAGTVRSFHVSGKVEASTSLNDMRLQRLLGHLSALLHPKPRSVLVVGFGAGITAGSFVLYPDVERIVICEIEPIIPPNIGPYFRKQNYDVLNDPRVTVVYDDARHYVLTTREKFDVITSDPIHPWVKGAASLYTQEYFEFAKQRLNPGGVITQWVPLYESTPAAVKSEIATFFKVFPGGAVWSNYLEGKGYDVVLSGQATQTAMDVDKLNQRLLSPEYAPVLSSLREVQLPSAIDLLATYVTQDAELRVWLTDAEINTDRNLRLQYIAGLGLNVKNDTSIYQSLRSYRWLPPRLFTGSPETLRALHGAIERQNLPSRPWPRQ